MKKLIVILMSLVILCSVLVVPTYAADIECEHSWSTRYVNPTCDKVMQFEVYCERCGVVKASYDAGSVFAEHEYTITKTNTSLVYICQNCGHSYAEEIQIKNPETPVVTPPVEEPFTPVGYTYITTEGYALITLVSKTEAEISAGMYKEDGTLTIKEVKGEYVMTGNRLVVTYEDELLGVFEIAEDGTLTEVENELSQSEWDKIIQAIKDNISNFDTEDIDRLTNAQNNILGLIVELKEALSAETKDYSLIIKIGVALAFGLATAVIALLIGIFRLRLRYINSQDIYDETTQATNKMFEAYQTKVEELMNQLSDKVSAKIDDAEAQRQKEAEASSLRLKNAVEQAKANLSIMNIVNDEGK